MNLSSKYRIVQQAGVFTVEERICLFFWKNPLPDGILAYNMFNEHYRPKEFQSLEEAQEAIKKSIVKKQQLREHNKKKYNYFG